MQGPHILVVEDDRAVRDSIVDVLADEGWTSSVASNGEEALYALEHLARPRLVLLDLRMPVLDGEGFLAALESRPELADVAVAVMSATSRFERLSALPRVVATLRKPFDVEEVLALVQRVVGREASNDDAGAAPPAS